MAGAGFDDVMSLARICRFRDCGHHGEPGCAVREAVQPDRLLNFHKLAREHKRDTMTVLERREQLGVWKARSRAGRVRVRQKQGA